jgi:hypothetical protein
MPPEDGHVRKIFQLKYVAPSRLTDLLQKIGILFPTADDQMKVLIVESSAAKVVAAEEIVKTLDVPQAPAKNIELTSYFLAERPQQIPVSDLPPGLDGVIAQLKKTFNLQSFQLLNTAVIRTQDGEPASILGAAGTGTNFNLSFERLSVISGSSGPTFHLSNLNFRLSSPDQTTWAQLKTSIDITAGQKVVVGKTSTQSPSRAVFLILTAKVVD